jgi:CYTH domain-containing protein
LESIQETETNHITPVQMDKVDESIKWRKTYKQGGIVIKYPYWKSLLEEKQIGTIHFINKEIYIHSNTELYRRLIKHNFIDNDLDFDLQLMKRDFEVEEEFKMEEYPRFHQLFCHQCLQKSQQQSKEFQEQIHKLDEECHKHPSHIYIVYPIPRGSNLLPKLSEYKNTRQVKFQQLEAVSKQAKQVYDELFAGTSHKFSVSTKEALLLKDLYSSHNRVDFDPTTLPYEDDAQVQTQTLGKFIEKTVEYLRWKVDRWRHDNIEVNRHDIVKLKLEKTVMEFNLQKTHLSFGNIK